MKTYTLITVDRYEHNPYEAVSVSHFRVENEEEAQRYFEAAVLEILVGPREDYDDEVEYEAGKLELLAQVSGLMLDSADWMVWAEPTTTVDGEDL